MAQLSFSMSENGTDRPRLRAKILVRGQMALPCSERASSIPSFPSERGISEAGCRVIVRPGQYLAHVPRLDDTSTGLILRRLHDAANRSERAQATEGSGTTNRTGALDMKDNAKPWSTFRS